MAITRRQRTAGTPIIYWPKDIESLFGISTPTRYRWEKCGKLPRRDAFLGGSPIGWMRSTIETALRGEAA